MHKPLNFPLGSCRQQYFRAHSIDAIELTMVPAPEMGYACQMIDAINSIESLQQAGSNGDRPLDELGTPSQVIGRGLIEYANVMPPRKQCRNKMAADKAASARH
jgi:hypothetical protein